MRDSAAAVSCQVIVELVAATTTCPGLRVQLRVDDSEQPLGVKVFDVRMNGLNICRDGFPRRMELYLANRSF